MLAISQPARSSPLVTLDMPTALSPRVVNALKADPRTIDIRSLAPHFYSLGALMLELFEEDELVDVMTDVCASLFCLYNADQPDAELQKASGRDRRPSA
jgi:hypothetical protein